MCGEVIFEIIMYVICLSIIFYVKEKGYYDIWRYKDL